MKNRQIFLWTTLALIPVLFLRDYTPANELRYLSIADEALRNGTLFTFSNHGIPYADKPPLYLWLLMLSKLLFGRYHMWFLSLFSLIPAYITVFTMNRWVQEVTAPKERWTASLMLLSGGIFAGMMVMLRMDMLMCMFITLSLYTFYRMTKGEGNIRSQSLLFPLYTFLALFTKGPLGLLIPLVCTIVYLLVIHRGGTIGRYWGWRTWLILILCCAVWFGAVYIEGGKDYINNLLFHQTFDRAVNAYHHKASFYYYFVTIWYSLFPWCLLSLGVIIAAAFKRLIKSDLQKFFFVVIVTSFVLLSLFSSKMEVYLMPVYPFIIYLSVLLLPHFGWNRWTALSIALPALLFVLVLPALLVMVYRFHEGMWGQRLFIEAAAILSMSGLIALFIIYGKKKISASIRILTMGLFLAIFVAGWALPKVNSYIGYETLCGQASQIATAEHLTRYCTWKLYRPENMDVYLGHEIQIVTPEELEASRPAHTLFIVSLKRSGQLSPYFRVMKTYYTAQYALIVIP